MDIEISLKIIIIIIIIIITATTTIIIIIKVLRHLGGSVVECLP